MLEGGFEGAFDGYDPDKVAAQNNEKIEKFGPEIDSKMDFGEDYHKYLNFGPKALALEIEVLTQNLANAKNTEDQTWILARRNQALAAQEEQQRRAQE